MNDHHHNSKLILQPPTIPEINNLFQSGWQLDKPMVFPMGLHLWAGFRPSEILRAKRGCLKATSVEVPNGGARSGPASRVIQSPALQVILNLAPPGAPDDKLIPMPPCEYQARFARITKDAGLAAFGMRRLRTAFIVALIWSEKQPEHLLSAQEAWIGQFRELDLTRILGFKPASLPPLASLSKRRNH